MRGFGFNEKYFSQIPALLELVNLGYKYLTPEQVFKARRKKLGDVLLENVLRRQIKKIHRIHYRGREYHFGETTFYRWFVPREPFLDSRVAGTVT